MEKKTSITLLLIFLVSIPIIVSIPQFLLFQGHVKIDGRIASQGTIINFSINGTEVANASVNELGEYGPLLIQGFSEYYGEPINITINGSEAEQKINYTYPQDIFLNLSALTEKALKITESFPETGIITITKAQTVSFSIEADSGYDDEITYSVFVDGDLIPDTNSYSYVIENLDKGTHNITIFATDGFLTVSREWELKIERPETGDFDGDTTNFSNLNLDDLDNVPNVVIEKTGKGKIEFLDDLNLTGVTDLDDKVIIKRGIVAIDTSTEGYPQLNKPARITLSGLSYKTIPQIFYSDGFTITSSEINQECDFCDIISYTPHPTTNGEIVFEVEHFSSFMAGESGNYYNLTLFDELDTCKSGIIGDLDLKLKDPDEGDEFKPGEEIEVKIEVKNNADDDKKIIVEAYLYNIDEDDVEKDAEERKKIRDGRDETFEFVFEVPDDFENDDYLIFVKVYEDGDEEAQCAEGAISIDLEREKHDVIIKDFSINPLSVTAGKSFDVFTEVQNIGKSDEDVYVVVEIKELGVLTESETFELEEFGEDDSFSETFSVKVPKDAKEGEYEVEIKAVFDGEETEETATISVLEKVPIELTPIDLTVKKAPEIQRPQKALETSSIIPIGLAIGILILIILIVIVNVRKRR